MILGCQGDQGLQHVIWGLLSIKSWIPFANDHRSAQRLFNKGEGLHSYCLKAIDLSREDSLTLLCRWLKQVSIELFAQSFKVCYFVLKEFITSLLCKELEKAQVELFNYGLKLMFGENRRQFKEEKVPSYLNDRLDYLEVENLIAFKITLQVSVDQLLILC